MADVTDRMVKAAQEWMRKQAGYLTLTDEAVRGLIEAALREQPEPEPEPVAWRWGYRSVTTGEMDWRGYVEIAAHPNLRSPEIIMQPLYTHPPQRKPLTDEEIHECFQQRSRDKVVQRRLITRAIERAHGIGGEK